MSVFLPYGSKQYVMVAMTVTVDGVVIEPTDEDNPAKMAFKLVDEDGNNAPPASADFKASTWERIENLDYIKCLVGVGGTYSPAPGRYKIYVRFTDSPEDVWLPADYVTIGANPAA